jgi:hypothetical protein
MKLATIFQRILTIKPSYVETQHFWFPTPHYYDYKQSLFIIDETQITNYITRAVAQTTAESQNHSWSNLYLNDILIKQSTEHEIHLRFTSNENKEAKAKQCFSSLFIKN